MIWFLLGVIIGVIWGFAIFAIFKTSSNAEDCENAYYRTPREVIERESTQHGVMNYCCPTCNNVVNARLKERTSPSFEKVNFCNKCGQALEWEEK